VISNPFDDIVPRVKKSKTDESSAESKKLEKKGTKLVIFIYHWHEAFTNYWQTVNVFARIASLLLLINCLREYAAVKQIFVKVMWPPFQL